MLEQGYHPERNPQGHAQKVMKDLSIEYDESESSSFADCWIFKGCTNVPEKLPPCVKVITNK